MGIGRWSRNEVHDPVKLAEASKVPSPFGARTCGQVLDTPLTCPHYSDGMRRKNTNTRSRKAIFRAWPSEYCIKSRPACESKT